MAQDTIVLGQLIALVSAELFDKLATLYKVNKGARKMTACLLVRLLQQKAPANAISAQRLMVFIAVRILMEIPINQAWQDFQRTRRKRHDKQKSEPGNVC